MNLEDLQEALEEIISTSFSIETDRKGQIVIFTGLTEGNDGELVEFEEEDKDEEDLDPDFDPDFEPLEDEDNEEDE